MSEVKLPSSPYGDFLGIQIKEAAAGSSVCHLELKDHHMNTGGRVHGGVLTHWRIRPRELRFDLFVPKANPQRRPI
jgi:hypothetical protein